MKQSTDIIFKIPFQVYHFTFPESPPPSLRAFLMRKLVGFVTVLSRHCNVKAIDRFSRNLVRAMPFKDITTPHDFLQSVMMYTYNLCGVVWGNM